MRNVIIHYHIFKNAGSSIDKILADSFGPQWMTLEGSTPTSLLSSQDVERHLEVNPNIRALSSHLARPPLPRNVHAFPIIFIRHPIDRAASVYIHERRATTDIKSSEVAKRRDFSGYVRWCLDTADGREQGGIVIRNYQVVHLSSASFRTNHIYHANADESDLSEVLQLLDKLPFLGIVEQFESSLQLLKSTTSEQWPELHVANIRENASPGRHPSLEARLQEINRELEPAMLDALTRENYLDLELHREATHKFRQLLADRKLA